MKQAVHLGGARDTIAVRSARKRRGKCLRIVAAAFEAGPVTGGKRGRLVEEEQLRIALAPHLAMPSLEFEEAANPGVRDPASAPQRAVVAMEAAAAIAEEQPARGISDEIAERIDAIGQRHGKIELASPGSWFYSNRLMRSRIRDTCGPLRRADCLWHRPLTPAAVAPGRPARGAAAACRPAARRSCAGWPARSPIHGSAACRRANP